MILTRIAEHCAARIPKSTSSVGGWYRLGPNDRRPHRVAQPFLASASASASQEREFGEDVRKRERSRARRTKHPRMRHTGRPVVSLGRSTTAESRGRRWTREYEGAADLGRTDGEEQSELRTGARGRTAPAKKHRPRVKRKRGWKGYSSVSHVVSVESDGIESGTPRVPASLGGQAERGRERNQTRFFVLSTRAALGSCAVCVRVAEVFASVRSLRKIGDSRGIIPQNWIPNSLTLGNLFSQVLNLF